MTRTSLLVLATAAVAIGVITVATVSGMPGAPSAPTQASRDLPTGASQAAPVAGRAPAAPAAPAANPTAATPRHPAETPAATPADPVGAVQPVPATANAQVALVASSLQTHDHPERLSALVQPPVFAPGSSAADYAAEIAPGRAFQSAQPGPNVPVISPVGPTQMTMDQDGKIYLRARSQPGAPTTFTSFDLGKFQNDLATQTVVADQNGVASVAFRAGPGTIDAVHVLAGSPQASGQVTFTITVQPAAATSAAVPQPIAPSAIPNRSGI